MTNASHSHLMATRKECFSQKYLCNEVIPGLDFHQSLQEAVIIDQQQKELAMPRKPRMYLGGVPCHVIQRGNNRNACFWREHDYVFYLDCLQDACHRYRVAVHAYVLMTNHVHLIMTPEDSDGISRTMQSLGRRYVQYVNFRYKRSGTLWEGRHRASLIDAESYFLACMRYAELNPVRANMVKHPADYRWSSYRINARSEPGSIISRHPLYLALGNDESQCRRNYRRLFECEPSNREIEAIRAAVQASMPLGDDCFKRQVEEHLGRPTGHVSRGRPRIDRVVCAGLK